MAIDRVTTPKVSMPYVLVETKPLVTPKNRVEEVIGQCNMYADALDRVWPVIFVKVFTY